MKKLYAVVVAIALAVPALAWSASPYVSSFKDGKYSGTISSKLVPDMNGKKVSLEVKHEGENAVLNVTYDDGTREVWTLNDKTLIQKELDKTNKVANTYGATAPKPATDTEQSFNINCKDKAKNDCDAGVDARNYWTLKATPTNEIIYSYTGVPKDKKSDATAKVEKRFEFKFSPVK